MDAAASIDVRWWARRTRDFLCVEGSASAFAHPTSRKVKENRPLFAALGQRWIKPANLPAVVPAQAGTHNHHAMLLSSVVPQRGAAAYGSPPARGRQQRSQGVARMERQRNPGRTCLLATLSPAFR